MYLLNFLCVLLPFIFVKQLQNSSRVWRRNDDITLFPFTLAGPFHIAIFMICSLQPNGRNVWVWDHYSPALAITELISNFPNPGAVGAPLIPLVESSLSITAV